MSFRVHNYVVGLYISVYNTAFMQSLHCRYKLFGYRIYLTFCKFKVIFHKFI